MLRRILFGLGAIAWGGVSYVIGLYATFPADAARDRIVYEFGEYYRNEYALSIGDLGLWRFSGATGDDVTFYSVKKGRRPKPKDGEEAGPAVGERTPIFHFDSLSVRAAPIPMIMGKNAAAFVGEMYGGAIDGVFAQTPEIIELAFDAGDIDLGRLPVETETMNLKLMGILQGEGDLAFDQTDVKKSTGFLKLSFEGLGLGADSLVAGFTLPEVLFTKAGVAFEVKDGKMEVTEGIFESETLDAELTGDVVLNKKLARSRNRLELVFSLPEDLDKLAQISPDLKRSRDDDGKYHMNIGGTVLSPSVRFTRAGVKRPVKGGDDDGPAFDNEGPRVGPLDGMGDDERRKAREERIRERRERLRKRREEAAARNGGVNEFDKDEPENFDEFDPDEPPPLAPPDGARFPPDGRGPMNDGPMMDGPPDMPPPEPPMDEGMPEPFYPEQ